MHGNHSIYDFFSAWNAFISQLTTGLKLEPHIENSIIISIIYIYLHFVHGIHINLCVYKRAQAYHLRPGRRHCYRGSELSSLNHPLRIVYPPDLQQRMYKRMRAPFQKGDAFSKQCCCRRIVVHGRIHTIWELERNLFVTRWRLAVTCMSQCFFFFL